MGEGHQGFKGKVKGTAGRARERWRSWERARGEEMAGGWRWIRQVGPSYQRKKKFKRERERGKGVWAAARLVALLGLGRGPVGLLLLFCSFSIFLLWFLCFLKFKNILKTKLLKW
jgi:hypothetical protein